MYNHRKNKYNDNKSLLKKALIRDAGKKVEKEQLSDDQLWLRRMKMCIYRTVIICNIKNDGEGKEDPVAPNYKGLYSIVSNFYPLDKKIFVIIQATCKKIKINFNSFYFCDTSGNKIAEPGQFPQDILDMKFD